MKDFILISESCHCFDGLGFLDFDGFIGKLMPNSNQIDFSNYYTGKNVFLSHFNKARVNRAIKDFLKHQKETLSKLLNGREYDFEKYMAFVEFEQNENGRVLVLDKDVRDKSAVYSGKINIVFVGVINNYFKRDDGVYAYECFVDMQSGKIVRPLNIYDTQLDRVLYFLGGLNK